MAQHIHSTASRAACNPQTGERATAVMPAWRWRSCPACRNVVAASELLWLWSEDYWEPWTNGDGRRMCPMCCHVGRTSDFPIVAERHPEPKHAEPIVEIEPMEIVEQLGLGLGAKPLSATAAGRTRR
jgi:hypothetical protein